MKYLALVAVWVLIALGGYYVYNEQIKPTHATKDSYSSQTQQEEGAPQKPAEQSNQSQQQESKPAYVTLRIPNFSFDELAKTHKIFWSSIQVPYTKAVLNETYKHLFNQRSQEQREPLGVWNGMSFKKAVLKDNTLHLYLTGQANFPGLMADVKFKKEIEAVAFSYDNVKRLIVYLNDEPFNSCVFDSKGDCQNKPWIVEKE